MSKPTVTPTLINVLYPKDALGNTQDLPIDGGNASQTAILFGILSELRVLNALVSEMAAGRTPVEDVNTLRQDVFTYLDPTFIRLS
jgi:hypothetical protein